MKIPTKDYSHYQVGDLIVFKEGQSDSDIGYIEAYEPAKDNPFKMCWFKDINSLESNERIETFKSYEKTYVFPVCK